ncbi:MAG: hypothetical protein J07HB67_01890 [halophilic archaeon J07HB67]|nr:MAG: hypothetical protein J07HB67_01890 [halophilic archaeon J07HB67]
MTAPDPATVGVLAQTSVTTDGSVGIALTVVCLLVVGIVAVRRWR